MRVLHPGRELIRPHPPGIVVGFGQPPGPAFLFDKSVEAFAEQGLVHLLGASLEARAARTRNQRRSACG